MKIRVLLASAVALLASATAQAQMSGVTVRPSTSGDWDTVTVIVNTYETCPSATADAAKSLVFAETVRFHGGVAVLNPNGLQQRWQHVVGAGPTDATQPQTTFSRVSDGIWSKMIVPRTYFNVPDSQRIFGLCFVLNGGPDATAWDREGKMCGDSGRIATQGDYFVFFDSLGLAASGPNNVKASASKMVNAVVPNPFVGSTKVSFSTLANGLVDVKVYNILGAEVATLSNGFRTAGDHTLTWNGATNSGAIAPKGTYIIRVNAANKVDSRVVIKMD